MKQKPTCSMWYRIREQPRRHNALVLYQNTYQYKLDSLFVIPMEVLPGSTTHQEWLKIIVEILPGSMAYLIGRQRHGNYHQLIMLWRGRLWAIYAMDIIDLYIKWNAHADVVGTYQGAGSTPNILQFQEPLTEEQKKYKK